MFCTTIIPTIGRPSLNRAVNSVLEQTLAGDDFEVIVVNDSGRLLPNAEWQRSNRVQIIHTQQRERSVARNAGAAIAQGLFLHFLDDDDWLLPGALEKFWNLSHQTKSVAWLYGGAQLVDRVGGPLIHLRHDLEGNCFIQVMAGEWIPLQASFIDTKMFHAAGGFNPLLPGNEDIDLCRRFALHKDVAGMPFLVACIGMGEENSSTDHERLQEYGRLGREIILNQPGGFRRLRASANNSYWNGRVARIYLTSAVWNVRRQKIFTALSRMFWGGLSLIMAGRHLFSVEFWHAVNKPYKSFAFSRGAQEANDLSNK